MPGSGNHGGDSPERQPGPTLGGKIQAEVSSALRLLFKNVGQKSVDVAIPAPMTLYLTELACESHAVSLEQLEIQVSDDPIQALESQERVINQLALIDTVPLAADAPCDIAPALCVTPVIERADAALNRVTFENVRFTESHTAPLEALSTEIWHKDVESFRKPNVGQMTPDPFRTKNLSLKDQFPKATVREHPRLFSLPIRKMPIPPHRFSQAVRDVFRSALAEKAGTKASNVQLKVIFERMNVAFYTSIQQDEQGHLLCVPKNELVGRNAQSKTGQALLERLRLNTENAYLVVGFRLDNQQDIRAMVPVDKSRP